MSSDFQKTLERLVEVFRDSEDQIPPTLQKALEVEMEGLVVQLESVEKDVIRNRQIDRLVTLLRNHPEATINENTLSSWERYARDQRELPVMALNAIDFETLETIQEPDRPERVQFQHGQPRVRTHFREIAAGVRPGEINTWFARQAVAQPRI